MFRRLLFALTMTAACSDKSDDTGVEAATTDGGVTDGGSTDGGAQEETGESLYGTHCEECHGNDAQGTPSGPNLKFEVQNHSDEQIVAVILNGKHDMPPIDVTEDQA